MNVLFLSQIVPYPPHGGVLQRGYNLIRELGNKAEVHLLAFVHPDVLAGDAAMEESRVALQKHCAKIEYFRLWPKASPLHRVAALTMAALSSCPFSVLAHHSGTFRQRVRELVASNQFDVIHADTIALAQFLDDRWPIPTVLTHHNIESQLMERRAGAEAGFLARRYLRREARKLSAYEYQMSRMFDVNVFVSRADEQKLAERIPGLQTAIVPNGVDVEYFTPRQGNGRPTLIYTGGMNMFANRDAVLYFLEKMWPLIKKAVPAVRFFAVGQDPPKELLDIAARDAQVVVTGYVNDVRPFVWDATVYVVPLRVGGGTRLKVLDAMAMGKAMVSTSIGCEGLDVKADVHLLVADEPAAFADKTIQLLRNAECRTRLGRNARELVEQCYSWKKIGRRLVEAYRLAIDGRRRRS
ncbi:MAG: glycosyltransferase family 4 protein [Nitrospira sp.]|nr:glycosyltransferase family 4 protein [Nitrospira sp.]MCP9462680.1 glycosyltransferase family 4 protein [Nitrospira sp.]MCP9476105.1 glycosyltransferase family 4 protein [Nitrospira sp.]